MEAASNFFRDRAPVQRLFDWDEICGITPEWANESEIQDEWLRRTHNEAAEFQLRLHTCRAIISAATLNFNCEIRRLGVLVECIPNSYYELQLDV